jgi:hypothetical protein
VAQWSELSGAAAAYDAHTSQIHIWLQLQHFSASLTHTHTLDDSGRRLCLVKLQNCTPTPTKPMFLSPLVTSCAA